MLLSSFYNAFYIAQLSGTECHNGMSLVNVDLAPPPTC